MKRNLVAIALLLSSLAGGHGDAFNDARIVKDGAYIGLSKMPSLSPEDPEVAWFHERTCDWPDLEGQEVRAYDQISPRTDPSMNFCIGL